MDSRGEFQDKIYLILVRGITILSLFSIAGNLLVSYSFVVNVKWIFMLMVSGILLNSKNQRDLKFVYFLGVLLILLPLGWIDAGGEIANSISYIFLLLITITFLFPKNKRNSLNIILLLVVFLLFFLERYFPDVARDYSESSQYFDRLIQIPLTLGFSYWILVQFINSYIDDKQKLEEANKKLKYLAMHDSLTNFYNRRAFDDRLAEILEGKEHLDTEIWLVLFDIDYFKRLNDNYGHKEGDKVLKKLSETTREVMGAAFISRWGGDEFCMIIEKSEQEFLETVETFFTKVREMEVEGIIITISAGVTKLEVLDDMLSLFKRVDDNLYKAKKQGRDRYVIE